MFGDETIQEWIDLHGTITCFSFIVYGMLDEENIKLLSRGLAFALIDILATNQFHLALSHENIDEEKAVALNQFQGTSINFIFGGDLSKEEKRIVSIVSDGLDFLRFKNEFLGTEVCESHV